MQTILSTYPRLVVRGAAEAIGYYRDVFDAAIGEQHLDDSGAIVHVDLTIGGVRVAVREEGYGDPAPPALGGTPVIMAVEVTDPDALAAAMLTHPAASVVHPLTDHPYGRGGRIADPFGHHWMLLRPAEQTPPVTS